MNGTYYVIADLDDVLLLTPAVYDRWKRACIAAAELRLPSLPSTEFFVALPDGRAYVACECPGFCTLFATVGRPEWAWAPRSVN